MFWRGLYEIRKYLFRNRGGLTNKTLNGYNGKMKISSRQKNTVGKRIGKLTAVSPVGRYTDGHLLWLCKCDCGNTTVVPSNNFRELGGTKSCGCLRKEAQRKRIKRDGVWNDGKSYSINSGTRCYKTRHAWAKAVIRFYGNKCSVCGWNKARCDAHHRKHKSKNGLHTIKNGIVLCPNCHREKH